MTRRRRRVGLIVFLAVVALFAAALGVARYYFSGPRLAQFLIGILFKNVRGRVEIDSIDWPFVGITGRNLPATVRGLRIYAPDQKTLVLSVDEATAVIDWPTVVFGRHDVKLENVVVHKAYALVRQYDVANPQPGDKPYEVGFVAALQGKRRPGEKPGAPSPGPIIEVRGMTLRDSQVHLEFPNWNAHVYGVAAKGVLRQSFRNPSLVIPDFTFMVEARVEHGSVEFAKQHFELADIVANRFGQYPYDPHSLEFSATAKTMEGASVQLAGKLDELYDPDPRKSSVQLRIDAHDGGELVRRLTFGVLAGTHAAGTVEIDGPMLAPQLTAEGRGLELVSPIPVTVEHVAGSMDIVAGEIAVAEAEIVTLGGRIEAKGRGNLTGSVITSANAPTVQKLVSKLTSAGLLRSSRGVGGGLKLARPAAAITLADIVEAVEGPIALTSCIEHGRHDCTLEDACMVRPHWPVVNEALRGALAQVPLTRLAETSR